MTKIKALDRNNARPLYAQLDKILRDNILAGVWNPNDKIPSENELAAMYNISRVTVRAVVNQMASEGLLYRVQGKGTFVAEPKIRARSLAYHSIREQLEELGYDTRIRFLHAERTIAPPPIADLLKLTSRQEVYALEWIRTLGDEPIGFYSACVPCHLVSGMDLAKSSEADLRATIEVRYGLKAADCMETFEAVGATYREAELLQVAMGFPLLKVEGLYSTAEGIAFEHTQVLFRGDKIKLSLRYKEE